MGTSTVKPTRLLVALFFIPTITLAQTAKPPTKLPPKKAPSTKAKSQATAEAETAPTKKASSTNLNTAKAIRLNYGLPAWNKDSTQIDSASILMREGNTGRIVQINLEETAPDSSQFSGIYSVQWESMTEMAPEFYVPPQDLLGTPQGAKKLSQLVQSNKLPRAPFILRRAANGQQNVELFDTPEQAREAMKAFRAEREAIEMQNKKILAASALEAARLAADARAREAAAKAAAERARLGQVEAKKAAELAAAFERLPEAEKAKRRAEALNLVKQGLELYSQSKFKESAEKFEMALEKDPTSRSYYFQYGIALYRLDQFNRSLVFISLAEGEGVNKVEQEFYRGLNFYRLKDRPNALASLKVVEEAKHPDLSPSASFYAGTIEFDNKNWEPAKLAFQRVLDTSKDPKLDQRAEEMIEYILRVQQFEAEKAKKWTLSATFGVNYDSNILQTSTSQLDAGTATDSAGYRFLQLGSLRYRPVYDEKKEFAAQLDVVNMYTVDDSFKSDQSLRNTDPLVLTLSTPYTHKGLAFKKGYKLDLVPGFETIYMSVEDNENKAILNSFFFNMLNTLVWKDTWFANYNLELRYDDTQLKSAVGDDDSTAVKVKLANNNVFIVNEAKDKIVTGDLAYTVNQANGDNAYFTRLDLAAGFIAPAFWEITYNVKLGYYTLDYSKASTPRKDNNITTTLAFSKKLSEQYSVGLVNSYEKNNSDTDTNEYNRISSMLTFSANWAL